MKKKFIAIMVAIITIASSQSVYAKGLTAGVVSDLADGLKYGAIVKERPLSAGIVTELDNQLQASTQKAAREQAEEEAKRVKAQLKREKKFIKASKNIVTKYVKYPVVNVRSEPLVESESIDKVYFNQAVEGFEYDGWFFLEVGQIRLDCLSDKKCNSYTVNAPWNSGWKSWMPYTAITATGSKQYKLETMAYTGNYGIRQIDGRYLVALGSYFGVNIGQYFDLNLYNGTIIPCIMGDAKANKDTDYLNATTSSNGCMSEFIVTRWRLNSAARSYGDVSKCTSAWDSPIESVTIYTKSAL